MLFKIERFAYDLVNEFSPRISIKTKAFIHVNFNLSRNKSSLDKEVSKNCFELRCVTNIQNYKLCKQYLARQRFHSIIINRIGMYRSTEYLHIYITNCAVHFAFKRQFCLRATKRREFNMITLRTNDITRQGSNIEQRKTCLCCVTVQLLFFF